MTSTALRLNSPFYPTEPKLNHRVSHGGSCSLKSRGVFSGYDLKVVAMKEKKRRRGNLKPTMEGHSLEVMDREFKHRVTMHVAAPLDHVWTLWVDLEAAPKWMGWISRVEILDEATFPASPSPPSPTESFIPSLSSPSQKLFSPSQNEPSSFSSRESEISSLSIVERLEERFTSGLREENGTNSTNATETEGFSGTQTREKLRNDEKGAEEKVESLEERKQSRILEPESLERETNRQESLEDLPPNFPRLNSLSKWICCTAGFEVAWVARIESVEMSPGQRVLRWTSVEGLSSHGEVRFTPDKSQEGTDVYLTAIHRLPPALSKIMNRHALSTVVQATLKSDLERFREYALSMHRSSLQ